MRKSAAVIAAVCVMCGAAGRAGAWLSKNDAGTSTAQFLKLGAGARAAGMGEAFAAAADNADAIYWNPACLGALEGRSLSVMHAAWFEDIAYDWAAYAQRIEGIGTIGIGVQYLSYGSITGTDVTGLENGNFSPSDLALSFSYAREVKGIGLGATVKYVSSKIRNSAAAFALDLGARCRLNGRTELGAAVQNVGTAMKFDVQEDHLPANVKLGGLYALRENWSAALDVNVPADNEAWFALGTEYRHRVNETMSAAGRLGYNTRAKDTGGLNGISAGLGFTFAGYTVDYAFSPYGDLGSVHRISLGSKF